MVLPHELYGLVGPRNAGRQLDVLVIGELGIEAEHVRAGPVHEPLPHVPYHDERSLVEVPHLEELPYHQRLQRRADPTRHDDEGVRRQDEVV